MEYPTVSALCSGVADAIRAKKGTTDLINPQDFSAEIASISGSGGGDSIEYLDVSGLRDSNETLRNMLVAFADIVKSKNEEGTLVGACLTGIQSVFGFSTNNATTCIAVAVDFSRHIKGKFDEAEIDSSIAEILIMLGTASQEQLDSIPRLTKEQFYSLE